MRASRGLFKLWNTFLSAAPASWSPAIRAVVENVPSLKVVLRCIIQNVDGSNCTLLCPILLVGDRKPFCIHFPEMILTRDLQNCADYGVPGQTTCDCLPRIVTAS